MELCRSLGLLEPRKPAGVPYTEDIARGFGSFFPPCDTLAIELNWYGAASDILLPRGEEGALFGMANGIPVLPRLVLRMRLLSTPRLRGVGLW